MLDSKNTCYTATFSIFVSRRRVPHCLNSLAIAWLLAMLLTAFCSGPESLRAEDWPQLLGVRRDGTTTESLPETLENVQPAWEYELGAGFAGPAVSGGRTVVFHRVADEVLLQSFNSGTGEVQWTYRDSTDYSGGYNSDNGPRCVPVIAGGRVYAFGSEGDLHCVSVTSGEAIWKRRLGRDYRAPEGYFGAGAAPVVFGERVFVCLGGRQGSAVVALDAKSGETVWTFGDDRVSYASPVLAKIGGKQQLLVLTRLRIVSLSLNGEPLWSSRFGKDGLTVTACSPLVIGDKVFLTASYNIGAQLLDLTSGEPRIQWSDDNTLSSQYTNVVHRDGLLFGTHGREDAGRAEFRCVDAETGQVKWSQTDMGVAHVILAGERMLVQRVQDGELLLLKVTGDRFTELGRITVSEDQLRAPPAFANGRLYVRTNNRRDEGKLLCLPLK